MLQYRARRALKNRSVQQMIAAVNCGTSDKPTEIVRSRVHLLCLSAADARGMGRRHNFQSLVTSYVAAATAGAAAVTAAAQVTHWIPVGLAGLSAFSAALTTMRFSDNATLDFTVAAEYEGLMERYQNLLPQHDAKSSSDVDRILAELTAEKELIIKKHAAGVGSTHMR